MANTTIELQRWLDLLRAGDDRGRRELINHASDRLQKLTRRMLKGYPQVRRWEQTDDVLQNALLRLYRALAEVRPESLRHFYNLAALQIRRELLDLSKHYFGPEGEAAKHQTNGGEGTDGDHRPLEGRADDTDEPETLEGWTEFHAQVEALPELEREVFNLLWYEGLSQPETAEVLHTSLRTVKRRWQAARLLLYQALHGDKPG
jgi:RNA polymerase sigma-70 factor (ECF subfamily)